jgi:CP family cyanate transporter-like MFS transporter
VGPLLGPIGADLSISHAQAGLLATIPLACMGMFALSSARLLARFGGMRVMTTSLAVITVAGLLRAVAPNAAAILLLTVLFGVGVSVAGTLLPGIVKVRFPQRATETTAIYSVVLNGSAAVSAALAVPLANTLGGWRGSLAAFAVVDAVLTVVWVTLGGRDARLRSLGHHAPADPRDTERSRRSTPRPESVARDRKGRSALTRSTVMLALVFGLQATIFFGLNAWLVESYVQEGWGPAAAGVLVGLLNFSTLPATLLVAVLAGRVIGRQQYMVLGAGVVAVAAFGLATVPDAGVAWAILAGTGLGTIFPLCMAAPVFLGRDAYEVTRATSIMLGAGYLIAASAPILLGVIRDQTASYSTGLWLMFATSVALLVMCIALAFSGVQRPAFIER